MPQTTINMTLYRLLLRQPGVTEAEATQAAEIDTSTLATRADLTLAIAELKADLTRLILTLLVAQVAVFATIVGMLKLFS